MRREAKVSVVSKEKDKVYFICRVEVSIFLSYCERFINVSFVNAMLALLTLDRTFELLCNVY